MDRRLIAAAACTTALLGVAAPPAGAAAKPPPPLQGTKPLTLGDLAVTWFAQPSLSVSVTNRIAVPVRPRPGASGRQRATFTFARVTKAGKVLDVIARRSLRSGRFTAIVPQTGNGTYRLTVAVGRTRRSVAVEVPPGLSECGPAAGPVSGTLQLNQTTVAVGQPITITIANTSNNCLYYNNPELKWQRADPANPEGWSTAATGPTFEAVIPPHERLIFGDLAVPANLPAGHYRVVAELPRLNGSGVYDRSMSLVATTEIDVTAAPAPAPA
ncbi:MAG: hypothetical protein QOC54_777 [Baekduia sp.]|jgi:hypothetical protein|nr:hypothetical protein [Baekduia sp.]